MYLPTKFGCDRSIVVWVAEWPTDRQTDRQTEWNDNKAHSLRTWRKTTSRENYSFSLNGLLYCSPYNDRLRRWLLAICSPRVSLGRTWQLPARSSSAR